ncbi:Cytochrome D ubiquinol oxidase, subunit 1 OS=Streptomyces glaucescens OX=1907 GN=SGLAU_16750 PE=3 SV=1 [Streptomyces glaucescens]
MPGINDTNEALQEQFGPGDYKPIAPVAYWAFRWMIGCGMASCRSACSVCGSTRRRCRRHRTVEQAPAAPPAAQEAARRQAHPVVLVARPWPLGFPLIANSWAVVTELGRQP